MPFSTIPRYSSDSESTISSEVPDEIDGVTCFAEAESTTWTLNQSSVAAIGPGVLATRSGVGRWIAVPSIVPNGYFFNLNGDLALADVDATPPAGDGGSAFFDGSRIFLATERITLFGMVQRCTGSAGNTTVEVWRYRAGAFFQLASMTVAAGAAFASATSLPPAGPDDVLVFGDLVLVRLANVQQDDGILTPCDLTVMLHTEVQP